MAIDPTASAIYLLANKLQAIRGHVQDVMERAMGLPAGNAMLGRYLIRICDVLTGYLEELIKDQRGGGDADLEVAQLSHAVLILSRMTRFVASGEISAVSQAIMSPWENLIKCINPDTGVIVRAQSGYEFESYLEVRETLEGLIPFLISQDTGIARDAVLRGFPKQFIVLNIPMVQSWNILHSALLAHEVGHFIHAMPQFNRIPGTVGGRQRAKLERIFAEKTSLVVGAPGFERQFAEFRAKISRVIEAWFKELLSDVVGARLIGPCMFYALRDFGLPGYRLDFLPEERFLEYPSFRRRFRLLLRVLAGYWEGDLRFEDRTVLRSVKAEWREWANIVRGEGPSLPAEYEFAGQIADECVEKAMRAVGREIAGLEYKAKWFRAEVFELYNRLVHGISPNEIHIGQAGRIGRPARWQSIINAAWLYYTHYGARGLDITRQPPGELSGDELRQRYREIVKFNEVISRSIELSIVQERFLRDKEALEGILDDPLESED